MRAPTPPVGGTLHVEQWTKNKQKSRFSFQVCEKNKRLGVICVRIQLGGGHQLGHCHQVMAENPSCIYKVNTRGTGRFRRIKERVFLIPWFETLTCENIQNENEMQELARSMELSTPTPQNNTNNSPVNTIINELEEHLGLSPSQKTDACLNNILLTALAAEKSAP